MKKISIMQPYYFPYLGYFGLIKHTDEFILFDTPQYIRHGWINRNRILKQKEGWLYIKVPLKSHSRETAIKDIRIDNSKDWKALTLSQLEAYKKRAPYYNGVIDIINELFSKPTNDITQLNKDCIMAVCRYLGIEREFPIFSQMDIKIDKPSSPDEWALNICRALDINEYWNPPGGMDFFDKSKYDTYGVNLRFHTQILKPYNQKRTDFEAGLSIIDVMMFNSPKEINNMLDMYELQ